MTRNLGAIERAIRAVLGVGLVGTGFLANLPGWATAVVYLVGAVMLATSAIGFCPAWKLFGINTCPIKTRQS